MSLSALPYRVLIIAGMLPCISEPSIPRAARPICHRAAERRDMFNNTRRKRQRVEIFAVKPGVDCALSITGDARSELRLRGDSELIRSAHRERIRIVTNRMPNHRTEVCELVIRNKMRISPPVDARILDTKAELTRQLLRIPLYTTEPSDSVRVPRSWHVLKIVNKPLAIETNTVKRPNSDVKSKHNVIVRLGVILQGVVKGNRVCVFEIQRLCIPTVNHPFRDADFQPVVVLIIQPMPAEITFRQVADVFVVPRRIELRSEGSGFEFSERSGEPHLVKRRRII